MARTSRNGAPAASFDALDNIDIDDMFADGGDDLFDGLADDLGLDQMGDITNNMGSAAAAEEDTAAGAAAEETPMPAPAPVVEEPPKRRKTKRKPKSPILLDEEEDANEAPLKKKRRSTKTGTTKKKSSKKDKDEAKSDAPKSKSKVKGIGMPTPIQRHASSSGPSTPGAGNVAAAGIFGGRQKRGQFSLPLSRGSSDKQKTKNKPLKAAVSIPGNSEGTASVIGGGEKNKLKKGTAGTTASTATEPQVPKKPAAFVPPIPQSTFCGLKPSSTMFYPFMPALPAEPSIKNRKQYPAIDRVNQSFMTFINNTTNSVKAPNGGAPVSESEGIHRLMMETLKEMNPSGAQSSGAAATDDKKIAISNAIGTLRQSILATEKPKLATDLFTACALLKRQYDFLQQNLTNMERWCKENFSEADYSATYGGPDVLKSLKEAATSENMLSKFKRPLIKVKLRCSGFKEPKLSGPLFAFLPPSVVPSGENTKEKKTTKKRKSASSDSALVASASGMVATPEIEVAVKTYPELRPAKRRQLITDHVAHTAKELEAACISRTAAFCQAIDRRHNELKKMVEEDEVLVIHTAAMWQYIEKAGYFSDISEEALNDTLRSIWAPEVKHEVVRDIAHFELSPAVQHLAGHEFKRTSRQSVFGGLQSLLVDEASDSEDEDDDDDYNIKEDERLLHDNLDEPVHSNDPIPPSCSLVDLSELSLDERTYMHVRRAGMLEYHVPLPSLDLSNGLASNSSRGRKYGLGDGIPEGQKPADDETLEDVIGQMSAHLLRLNKLNNSRASFLESTARTQIPSSTNRKGRTRDETTLLTKCQQLLKRSKDSKVKSSKPKTATKDEYALPW